MKFKSHRLIAASTASALAFGGMIGAGSVFAQSSEDPATNIEKYISALDTNRFGITTTNLQLLEQAVADGDVTAEEAEEDRTKFESGTATFFGVGSLPDGYGTHGGRGGHGGHGGMLFGSRADVAGFLGISEEDLRTALTSGQTLAQLAEANGKTRQELVDFLVTSANAAIDQAVADGTITAEQAAEMKEKAAERAEERVDSTGRMRGGPRGRGPAAQGEVN